MPKLPALPLALRLRSASCARKPNSPSLRNAQHLTHDSNGGVR
jgi:hypothetical protein